MNATTLGMWRLSNPFAVGASILYDGLKGSITSSVLITPSASQVAKVLRSGGAGFALSYAVEQLLGAVDWVLDPANNRIKYKVSVPDKVGSYGIQIGDEYKYFNTAQQACDGWLSFNIAKHVSWQGITTKAKNSFCLVYGGINNYNGNGGALYNPVNESDIEEKNLSLETVAQKVIENAQNNNLDAQFAVLAAATNILSEAEKDDAKAKPIEEELERNAKCPSGIKSGYGQCWICPNEEKLSIENNKKIAKLRAQTLGSCQTGGRNKTFKDFDKNEFLVRAVAWDTLAEAREAENMCWLPPHQPHVVEAQTNRGIAETCRAGAAQVIK
ncbi:hypothetical protein ACG94X_15460 [Acinetobacter sp. ULE_I010]|uniref:hypothetical protein n=1 Tax=Acinetobacter sp. ULE_I010 TaxID=3373065 RepID=UPI003AF8610C